MPSGRADSTAAGEPAASGREEPVAEVHAVEAGSEAEVPLSNPEAEKGSCPRSMSRVLAPVVGPAVAWGTVLGSEGERADVATPGSLAEEAGDSVGAPASSEVRAARAAEGGCGESAPDEEPGSATAGASGPLLSTPGAPLGPGEGRVAVALDSAPETSLAGPRACSPLGATADEPRDSGLVCGGSPPGPATGWPGSSSTGRSTCGGTTVPGGSGRRGRLTVARPRSSGGRSEARTAAASSSARRNSASSPWERPPPRRSRKPAPVLSSRLPRGGAGAAGRPVTRADPPGGRRNAGSAGTFRATRAESSVGGAAFPAERPGGLGSAVRSRSPGASTPPSGAGARARVTLNPPSSSRDAFRGPLVTAAFDPPASSALSPTKVRPSTSDGGETRAGAPLPESATRALGSAAAASAGAYRVPNERSGAPSAEAWGTVDSALGESRSRAEGGWVASGTSARGGRAASSPGESRGTRARRGGVASRVGSSGGSSSGRWSRCGMWATASMPEPEPAPDQRSKRPARSSDSWRRSSSANNRRGLSKGRQTSRITTAPRSDLVGPEHERRLLHDAAVPRRVNAPRPAGSAATKGPGRPGLAGRRPARCPRRAIVEDVGSLLLLVAGGLPCGAVQEVAGGWLLLLRPAPRPLPRLGRPEFGHAHRSGYEERQHQ